MTDSIDQASLIAPVSVVTGLTGFSSGKIGTAIERVQQMQDQLGADPSGAHSSVEARFLNTLEYFEQPTAPILDPERAVLWYDSSENKMKMRVPYDLVTS